MSRRAFLSLLGSAGLALARTAGSAFALDDPSSLPLTSDRVSQAKLLYSAEISSCDIGLGSVDFGSVTEGGSVPVYECRDGGLVLTRSEVPLSSNGEVFGSYSRTLGGGSQLSLAMGKVFERFIDTYNTHEIALIVDANGMSIYDGNRLERVVESYGEFDTSDLGEVESLPRDILASTAIRSANVLSGETFDPDTILSRAVAQSGCNRGSTDIYGTPPVIPNDYVYHAISGINQGDYPICWAASIAYIKNFKHGTSHCAAGMAYICAGNDWSSMKNCDQVAGYLQNQGLGDYTHLYYIPSIATIHANMVAGYLLILSMNVWHEKYNHMAVIMGASHNTDIVGIHDSNDGDFYYVEGVDYDINGVTYKYIYWNYIMQRYVMPFKHIRRHINQ